MCVQFCRGPLYPECGCVLRNCKMQVRVQPKAKAEWAEVDKIGGISITKGRLVIQVSIHIIRAQFA